MKKEKWSWLLAVSLLAACLQQDSWPPVSSQRAVASEREWEAYECRFPRELGSFENRGEAVNYLLAQGYRRTWYYDCGERELGYCSPDFTREMPFQPSQDDREFWAFLPQYPVPFGRSAAVIYQDGLETMVRVRDNVPNPETAADSRLWLKSGLPQETWVEWAQFVRLWYRRCG